MTESMIERVAKAIYCEFENRPAYAQAQMNGVIANECARAAIEAMREPTAEMTEEADSLDWPDPNDVWRTMVAAALKENSVAE